MQPEVLDGICVSCSVMERLLNKGNRTKGFEIRYEDDKVVLRYNYRLVGVGFGFTDWEWDTIRGNTVAEVLEKIK